MLSKAELLMRFADGDVIVHLGPDFSDTLLLHKSVLQERSTFFASALSGRWESGQKGLDGKTEVWTLGMAFDVKDSQWTLGVKPLPGVISDEASASATRIWYNQRLDGVSTPHPYKLPSRENPTYTLDGRKSLNYSGAVHRALFSYLYGRHTFYKDAIPDAFVPRVLFLADVGALADFYGCLPHIAEVINRKFSRCGPNSELWKDVMDEPAFYLGLGTLLRNYELFADAMKHYAGRSECFIDPDSGSIPGNLAHETDLDPKVTSLAIEKWQGIVNRVRDMNKGLKSALNKFGNSHSSVIPKDPNIRAHKKTEPRRAQERAVKDSLNDYLEEYLSSKSKGWPDDGRPAARIGGAAPHLDLDIIFEKAKRTRIYDFLGKHRQWTANGGLGPPKVEIYMMTKALGLLRDVLGKGICGDLAHHKYGYPLEKSYLTNIPISKDELPWSEDYARPDPVKARLEPASEDWLKNMGLVRRPKDSRKRAREEANSSGDTILVERTKCAPLERTTPLKSTIEANQMTLVIAKSRKRAAEDTEPLEGLQTFKRMCNPKDDLLEDIAVRPISGDLQEK